jgi:Arsenate reductase and related proteins, glutaredoxin family
VAYLEGKGVTLNKHDLAKDPPSRGLLERLLAEGPLEEFVNTRSPAYKARNLDVSTMTRAEAIDLMLEEPNLIRRPLLLHGRDAVFGYKPERYDD